MRLTGHSCQGKCKSVRIGDLSGAFAVLIRALSCAAPEFAGKCKRRAAPVTGTGPDLSVIWQYAVVVVGAAQSGCALLGSAGFGWLRPVQRCPVATVHHRARTPSAAELHTSPAAAAARQ